MYYCERLHDVVGCDEQWVMRWVRSWGVVVTKSSVGKWIINFEKCVPHRCHLLKLKCTHASHLYNSDKASFFFAKGDTMNIMSKPCLDEANETIATKKYVHTSMRHGIIMEPRVEWPQELLHWSPSLAECLLGCFLCEVSLWGEIRIHKRDAHSLLNFYFQFSEHCYSLALVCERTWSRPLRLLFTTLIC